MKITSRTTAKEALDALLPSAFDEDQAEFFLHLARRDGVTDTDAIGAADLQALIKQAAASKVNPEPGKPAAAAAPADAEAPEKPAKAKAKR